MKSFKEYANTTTETSGTENTQTPFDAETLMEKIANAYHGKSDRDILKNILMEAEKSKRAGTLTNDEIETFYQSFAPMLDTFQRTTLRMVIEQLKSIE